MTRVNGNLSAWGRKTMNKDYRPFKSMRELTEIVYSNDWEYNNLSVGNSLWIRRKGDEHVHIYESRNS